MPKLINLLRVVTIGASKQIHGISDESNLRRSIAWLTVAQDATEVGGVSAWYSYLRGWGEPFIETTGYTISTFLRASNYFNDKKLINRAIAMGDYVVSMQHSSGGYRTYPPTQMSESNPTEFNTGQDILGLADLYEVTHNKKYLESLILAADFLVKIQNSDGTWTEYTYGGKARTYNTRVSWALLRSWQLTNKISYRDAARKNLKWALSRQLKNGWFRDNALPYPNPIDPYTHTIAYVLEGLLGCYDILHDEIYFLAAQKTADKLLEIFQLHHFMAGTYDSNWHSKDHYSCLTGDAQIAGVWLTLYSLTHNRKYIVSAREMIDYLNRRQCTEPAPELFGAIAGSWPIFGDLLHHTGYCRLAYPNWAAKFYCDALLGMLQQTEEQHE